MNLDQYIPLLSGFAGALIGAFSSLAAVMVQAHYQGKREMAKEALSLALVDWKFRYELMKDQGGTVPHLANFVYYHTRLIELTRTGKLSPKELIALSEDQDQIFETLNAISQERRNKARQARS